MVSLLLEVHVQGLRLGSNTVLPLLVTDVKGILNGAGSTDLLLKSTTEGLAGNGGVAVESHTSGLRHCGIVL